MFARRTAIFLTMLVATVSLPGVAQAGRDPVSLPGGPGEIHKSLRVETFDGRMHTYVLRKGNEKFGLTHIQQRAKLDPDSGRLAQEDAQGHQEALDLMDTEWSKALAGIPNERSGRRNRNRIGVHAFSHTYQKADGTERKLCIYASTEDFYVGRKNYGELGIFTAFTRDYHRSCN